MMSAYTKQVINYQVVRYLTMGFSNNEVREIFLMMKMHNDMRERTPQFVSAPLPREIYDNLIGNNVIAKQDFQLEKVKGYAMRNQKLLVRLSPEITLNLIKEQGSLYATINENIETCMHVSNQDATDVAMWIIRQKENLEAYLNDWETCLNDAAKKNKEQRMATLAIKSIFKDAMKDYPDLEYEFIEQQKRLRIKVRMPNSKLGVILDAWWGSYQKKLPKEIEDLKTLIEAHSKTDQMNFYIIHKQEKN